MSCPKMCGNVIHLFGCVLFPFLACNFYVCLDIQSALNCLLCRVVSFLYAVEKPVYFVLAIIRVGYMHESLSNIWRRIYFIALWSHASLAGLIAIVLSYLWCFMVLCIFLIFSLHVGTARIGASVFWLFFLCKVLSFLVSLAPFLFLIIEQHTIYFDA